MKKQWLAALLNIVPGLGYLYVGVRKTFAVYLLIGVSLAIAGVFTVPADYYAIPEDEPIYLGDTLTTFAIVAFMVAYMVDAYKHAVSHNEKLAKKK